MKYIVDYSDDSEGYLAHYGVKGMHWGVWNEETRARRNGSNVVSYEYGDRYKNKNYRTDNLASTKKYDKARWKAQYGPNASLRGRFYAKKAERNLNKLADKTIKAYNEREKHQSVAEREKIRKNVEKKADRLIGESVRYTDGYAATITDLEYSRALDKAVPKGRDAVKKVIKWDNVVVDSPKVRAANDGIPVKTKREKQIFNKLYKTYNEEREKAYFNEPNSFDKIEKEYNEFFNKQLRKYSY